MRRIFRIAPCAIAATAIALASVQASSADAGVVAQARGVGKLNTVAGPFRSFNFSAKRYADGSVAGRATIKNRTLGHSFWIDLDCFHVAGNHAVMSGVAVRAEPRSFEGKRLAFSVTDNGDGSSAADTMSRVVDEQDRPCATIAPVEQSIVSGDIEVTGG
jgi:hypothetical protein